MVLEKEHFNTLHFFLLFLPQPKEYTATLLVNLHGPTHLNSTEEEIFLSPSLIYTFFRNYNYHADSKNTRKPIYYIIY